jgi:hypothetical protein
VRPARKHDHGVAQELQSLLVSVRPEEVGEYRARWVASGEPYCDHSSVVTVQDMGCPPEELCCVKCGLSWDKGAEVPEPVGTPPPAAN